MQETVSTPSAQTMRKATRPSTAVLEIASKPLPFGRLPVELVLSILPFLHPAVLCSVAGANKYLHELATPFLYRFIHLHHPHRAVLLFRTLLASPTLAQQVLSFRRSDAAATCDEARRLAEELGMTEMELQEKALRCAHNMQSLRAHIRPTGWNFPEALGNVAFLMDGTFKLRNLELSSAGAHSVGEMTWNQLVVSLLKVQGPHLESLSLGHFRWHWTWTHIEPLKPKDFPKLRKLTCTNGGSFENIYPMCCSTVVSLSLRTASTEEMLDLIVFFTKKLRRLIELDWTVHEFEGADFDICQVLRSFPSLLTFGLHFPNHVAFHPWVS